MDLNKNAYEQLKLGISTYVDKKIKDAPYDVTKIGTTMSAWQGRCSVKIDGMIYPITQSQVTDLEAGEKVYVLIPQNNYSLMTITGRVNPVAKKKETTLKNWFYYDWQSICSQTYNGLGFYNNGEGSISLHGTLTTTYASAWNGDISLPAGQYWISGVSADCGNNVWINITNSTGSTTLKQVFGGKVASITFDTTTRIRVIINIKAGTYAGRQHYIRPIITDRQITADEFIECTEFKGTLNDMRTNSYSLLNCGNRELNCLQRTYALACSNATGRVLAIYLNNTNALMVAFDVNLKLGYTTVTYRFSFYNYAQSTTWLYPQGANKKVIVKDKINSPLTNAIYMGMVAPQSPCVAFNLTNTGAYLGVSITNLVVSYRDPLREWGTPSRDHDDKYDLFTLTHRNSLPAGVNAETITL